jgi:hypothetical protein
MATRTVELLGVDFEVTYSATPFHPATFNDPAYGGDVEIESVSIGGFELDDGILSDKMKAMLQTHVAANVDSWAAEDRASAAEDEAERRYEERLMREAA